MRSAFQLLLLCLGWLFWFVPSVHAVSVDVSGIPQSISISPFSVTVSVTGANSGKNYLRIDLFKEGTSNYFGETYNGSEWYFGSVGTSYLPIDISASSTASAVVQAQVGEPSAAEYAGSGAYKLRIRRYTSASSYSTSATYDIAIDVPTPTPSFTPIPTPTVTASPTKIPTPSPIVTVTKTPTPSPTHMLTSTAVPTDETRFQAVTQQVLGAVDSAETSRISSSSGLPTLKPIIISLLFVSSGLALLSGVFVWQKWRMTLRNKT